MFFFAIFLIWAVNCKIHPQESFRHSAEGNQLVGIFGVAIASVRLIESIGQFIRNEYFYLDVEGIRKKYKEKIWWEEIIEIREEKEKLKFIYKKRYYDKNNYKAERGIIYMVYRYIYDFISCVYGHVSGLFRKFFEQDKNEKEKREDDECEICLYLVVKGDRQKVREMIWEYWEKYR